MTDPAAIPPVFDPGFYRAEHGELGLASDAAAAEHYAREGQAEGRTAARLARREGLLEFVAAAGSVLEIGPFCRPLLRGEHVHYLDVLDADGLRARAERLKLDPAGCPERIHYVGGLEQVDQRYEVVVSSHAIEHQPDLVRHLEEVERVLAPGGWFALIVPDKRYCFDHFLPESSIADVLQAHDERRTVHSLASVVEHQALTTHNDTRRHWAGDHGRPDPADRAVRVRRAMDAYARSEGGYVDVHAWQFTPASFRAVAETLHALGLTRLEAIAVYETPRDRNEFCALLQLRRPPRPARAEGERPEILFLQTADPFRYFELLGTTAPSVIEFCRRHGHRYESYVGVRRGFHLWQATYNRIPMLADLLARGFEGWAAYLDADAYINDLDFDLAAYLAGHDERPAIFATSGVTGAHWDVNAGVAFINFGHPEGRRLVEAWAEAFAAIPDARLREGAAWANGDNDQDLLQAILRRDTALGHAVLVESMELLNSPHARFVRQHLRARTGDIAERRRSIAAEVHDIFAQDGVRSASEDGAAILDERGRFGLFHPVRFQPRLVAAPAAAARLDLAERAIATWRAADVREGVPPWQEAFAEALDRGDVATVAGELAAIGRATLAQGFLGGARQHRRAETEPVFAFRRAQRTYDALLSLAETVGGLPFENPDHGEWAGNPRLAPEALVAAIEPALGCRLAPPPQVGGHLGIAAGGTLVLHLRMIEAAHAAWRLRQLLDEDEGGSGRVIEVAGGPGFVADYLGQLGTVEHAIVDTAAMQAVQAHVTAGAVTALPLDRPWRGRGFDLAFVADGFFELPEPLAVALLQRLRATGVRRLLAVSQEGRSVAESRATMAELARRAGGLRRIARQRHALRPGHVEEVYAPCRSD